MCYTIVAKKKMSELCLSLIVSRSPEVYTALASEDASEGEDVDGDYVGEMLDLHKGSGIETQPIEKHDVRKLIYYYIV